MCGGRGERLGKMGRGEGVRESPIYRAESAGIVDMYAHSMWICLSCFRINCKL